MKTALVVYIPVLHQGYLDLIRQADASAVYVLSDELLEELSGEFDYLRRKDAIRALPGADMMNALRGVVKKGTKVQLADRKVCELIAKNYDRIVMPKEDVSHAVAQMFFARKKVEFISVFLRWDREAVLKEEAAQVGAGYTISAFAFDQVFMGIAEREAEKSADWWRQVGAVLVKDGALIYTAHNEHTPHPQAPYAFGDPRSIFKRGIRIECSTAEHAEAAVIAEAASQGISTKGALLYVTVFPCPPCATMIAHAGIKRCYFASGYAVLDGAHEMRRKGVELIYVDTKAPRD